MEREETPERAREEEDAARSVAVYLRARTQLSETEAYERGRVMLRNAAREHATERHWAAGALEADLLERPWWTLALRGLLAIVVGILFLTRPVSAMAALVLVFGAWTFVDGVLALVAAVTREKSWNLALAGVVGIGVGTFIMVRPGIGLLAFYVMVAVWAMARGIGELAHGSGHGRDAAGSKGERRGLVFLGILSFAFGLLMLIAPQFGVVALSAWIGVYALLFGGGLVATAFPLRRAQHAAHAH